MLWFIQLPNIYILIKTTCGCTVLQITDCLNEPDEGQALVVSQSCQWSPGEMTNCSARTSFPSETLWMPIVTSTEGGSKHCANSIDDASVWAEASLWSHFYSTRWFVKLKRVLAPCELLLLLFFSVVDKGDSSIESVTQITWNHTEPVQFLFNLCTPKCLRRLHLAWFNFSASGLLVK